MSYDDINSYTTHAGMLTRRADGLLTAIDTAFWNMKIRNADWVSANDANKARELIAEVENRLKDALKDLDVIKEEMKMYKS